MMPDQMIEYFFKLLDADGGGTVSTDELIAFLKAGYLPLIFFLT